ncbi:hypothetical protein C8R43DRAFT_943754 [Mycena crocata]|nr:hypothetical protein C8R43DRAFT_943754 [Mycena crocata]
MTRRRMESILTQCTPQDGIFYFWLEPLPAPQPYAPKWLQGGGGGGSYTSKGSETSRTEDSRGAPDPFHIPLKAGLKVRVFRQVSGRFGDTARSQPTARRLLSRLGDDGALVPAADNRSVLPAVLFSLQISIKKRRRTVYGSHSQNVSMPVIVSSPSLQYLVPSRLRRLSEAAANTNERDIQPSRASASVQGRRNEKRGRPRQNEAAANDRSFVVVAEKRVMAYTLKSWKLVAWLGVVNNGGRVRGEAAPQETVCIIIILARAKAGASEAGTQQQQL